MKIVNFAARAILGMAHYGSARAFAVNPARLTARPCGLPGIDRSARPSKKESGMPKCTGSALSKIEQADRRACGNFALDKESPIQG